jgi:tetratricopeptide (TPR) repeat protein
LRSLLSFYERFAQQNAKNPRLQGEAAWAYCRVGALYEQLGRDAEADAAIKHAVGMLENLVAQFPGVAEYRVKLVDTIITEDPWSASTELLKRLAGWLKGARALIDELAASAPDNVEYAQSQVHVHAKLATVLARLGRPDEAETSYRHAIELENALVDRSPQPTRVRLDRSDTREALAVLLLSQDRPSDVRGLLDRAAADLQSLAAGSSVSPPLADRFRGLAEAYRKLGAPDRADELAERASGLETAPNAQRPPGGQSPARP